MNKVMYIIKRKVNSVYHDARCLIERPVANYRREHKLLNKDFTIISNNCWGGFVYQEYNLPYNTPTIGLLFFADDYIRFVSNLKHYIDVPLSFIKVEESKHYKRLVKTDACRYMPYPIGKIDDVEIVFLHYKSEQEAKEKWDRRKSRINWNNLLIKFNDQNDCTEEDIAKFNQLDYKNKICFTAKRYPQYSSCIQLPKYEGKPFVKDDTRCYKSQIDITKTLNAMK